MRDNRAGFVQKKSQHKIFRKLFPDPVGELIDNPALADEIRGRQVVAIKTLTPLMLLANFIAILTTIWVLYGTVDVSLLFGWSAAVVLINLIGAANINFKWKVTPRLHPRKHTRRAQIDALILASAWSFLPILFFHDATESQKIFITAIVAGMMGGGTMALGIIPKAANTFSWILAASSFFVLFSGEDDIITAVSIVLIAYCMALSRAAHEQGRRFVSHFADDHELNEQRATIGMLLKDFEDSSSDWMWQTDEHGNILEPSARFLESVGMEAEELDGKSFKSLVSLPQSKGSSELIGNTLEKRLQTALVFRDHMVQIDTIMGPMWWNLTGKPIVDSNGILQGFRGTASDVQEAKNAQDKLSTMALYDQLTGLPNRNRFYEVLRKVTKKQFGADAEKQQDAAVLYVDLDRFKSINDNLGHSLGDALLRETANRLEACIDENCELARFGGDEFALLLRSDTILEDAEAMADQILHHLARPYLIQNHTISLKGSIGIALSENSIGDSEAWFRNADIALFEAKADGGGQYKVFKPQMGKMLEERRQFEVDLREAVANKKFELCYQPTVDLETGKIVNFEALVCWDHPTRGALMSKDFIGVAEEAGLVKDIGSWALTKACEDAAMWDRPYPVSIAVSAAQIASKRLLLRVMKTLETSGLEPYRLRLEVSETALNEQAEGSESLFFELQKLGLSLSLDQYGNASSSLSHLVHSAFDNVNIDGALFQSSKHNEEDRMLVQSIIDLATRLGKTSVAKGVESEELQELVQSLGCVHAQGSFIQEPERMANLPELRAKEKCAA